MVHVYGGSNRTRKTPLSIDLTGSRCYEDKQMYAIEIEVVCSTLVHEEGHRESGGARN